MDPNANLREQESIVFHRLGLTHRNETYTKGGARLRELRQALRAWLDRGGFEPDWTLAPHARKYYGR